ncbi:hypothetical protein [Nocardia brasiliensis]|uniref:hypothetical protein n=1 Tax=Nocardia brasiliensis TaxID=37326 RepID=UPI002455D63B|nr:hypothetical protein [Nocardia brasiliensis]
MPDPASFVPEPGPTGITVHTSCKPRFLVQALTRPVIHLNGHPVPENGWGTIHIPVTPGQHHLQIATGSFPKWWPFGGFRDSGTPTAGAAEAVIPVVEGCSTSVFYRTPMINRFIGSIGPVPQKARGMLWAYFIWALCAVFVFFMLYALIAPK